MHMAKPAVKRHLRRLANRSDSEGPQSASQASKTNGAVRHGCCLTFDMSGGAKGAKRPLGRPLDGGVRCHAPLTWRVVELQRLNVLAALIVANELARGGYTCSTDAGPHLGARSVKLSEQRCDARRRLF